MSKYTVLTADIRKDFTEHKIAFDYYNSLSKQPKGVFKILRNNRVGGVNLSCTILEEYKILECHNLKRAVI